VWNTKKGIVGNVMLLVVNFITKFMGQSWGAKNVATIIIKNKNYEWVKS